ncbi:MULTISPECIES: riboflavin synthase subunit alpha [unclassified Photobacterium]|uniref:riboflavin synthase subunit alpha n=1 Tax=unclassified Photobacterium TaxID=2628852 RepID=UPI000D16FBAA|nr:MULTISPECIES: riboflavin synthase subunit alpha [unclassified Photobacterium]PSV27285.1 riboflavin synthase [Photobacterium sp. GB-56]PSV32971.1 riboflavin synthase [Photobacterium sp. GB-72]PSV36336.1 riboflavin synthase [Photobacterium sp. GB-27]PSV41065.1 riboflavin synthase [Photobacterium sp. GB-210]PSV47832.1 riboflavin synthase [Photobacterium sp. GB-36]
MFTGIVQGTAEIISISKKQDFQTHVIRMPANLLSNVELGASVAHNGCCLTVAEINDDLWSFDLMQETLNITNLGLVKEGDVVNVERAAKFGDEIGGHSMSGHIMCTAEVSNVVTSENNHQIWFTLPQAQMKYVFTKGYIGIDGISLTIGDVVENRFNVNLIPETLQRTNLKSRVIGDVINIEIDPQTQAIVDTVERVMAAKS